MGCVADSLQERLKAFFDLLGRMTEPEAIDLFRDSYSKWRQVAGHEALAKLLTPGMLSECLAEAKRQIVAKCMALLAASE